MAAAIWSLVFIFTTFLGLGLSKSNNRKPTLEDLGLISCGFALGWWASAIFIAANLPRVNP